MKVNLRNRVSRIEDHVLMRHMVPPSELVPYLNGEEIHPSKAEAVKKVYEGWFDAYMKALERKLIGLGEALGLLPDKLREGVIEAIRRRKDERREERCVN